MTPEYVSTMATGELLGRIEWYVKENSRALLLSLCAGEIPAALKRLLALEQLSAPVLPEEVADMVAAIRFRNPDDEPIACLLQRLAGEAAEAKVERNRFAEDALGAMADVAQLNVKLAARDAELADAVYGTCNGTGDAAYGPCPECEPR
jgi:hypothetical protein